MTINLKIPDIRELKPRITVFGTGGAGGNAVNNMITSGLQGVDFVVANTDAQALTMSKAERIIQMGVAVTEGLGAGSQPEVGRAAAEEVIDEIRDHLQGAHMVFVTAGMGGGTGTGAAPVVARCAKEVGILTVGVVTKPFHFEGVRRMRVAEAGIIELHKVVDTLLIIPNQNLFRVANEKTTFADAFAMADQVLYSGVACITDLMVKEGLINLDFADVRAVMREMGKAMMGTGEASGEKRALSAAEAAISNPLIDDASMKGAQGPADLDHRRQGPHALRGRRGRDPHPRGGRSGRQHHRRRDLRREPRRHHPRVGGGDRHRPGRRLQRPATAPEARIAELTQKLRADQLRAERSSALCRARRAARRSPPAPADGARAGAAAAPGRRSRHAAKAAVAAAVLPMTDRGRDDPADPAEAVAVPGAARRQPAERAAGTARLHPAGAGAPGHRRAADAADRRTAAAGPERAAGQARRGQSSRSIRRSARWACCGGSLRSASAGARQDEPERMPHEPAVRRGPATPPRPARCAGRPMQRPRAPSAAPGHAAARAARPGAGLRICQAACRTRGSTRSAGRLLCIIRWRTISSISRPSCAGRRTEPAGSARCRRSRRHGAGTAAAYPAGWRCR